MPSRPGEFHPEPLTGPDLTLSRHPARATARRLPPSVEKLELLLLPVGSLPTAMTCPLRSTSITPASSPLQGSPPLAGASVLSASRLEPLAPFPWGLVGRFSQSEWIHGVHWPVAVAAAFNAPIPSAWLKRATSTNRTPTLQAMDCGAKCALYYFVHLRGPHAEDPNHRHHYHHCCCSGGYRNRCRCCPTGSVERAKAHGSAGNSPAGEGLCSAGHFGDDPVGLVRQRRIAPVDRRFRGYSCLRNHVAFPWATVARSHHRRAQEAAHRLAWTWADDDYGSRLRQRRRTGRRFADQNQQNCRATLGCEFQHPRPVRTVSERVS